MVAMAQDTCLIWNVPVASKLRREDSSVRVEGSDRVGCRYVVTRNAELTLNSPYFERPEGKKAKARLVTSILDRHVLGEPEPRVTYDDINAARGASDLPVHVRAERLLRLLASMSEPAGRKIPMSAVVKDRALAWTESLEASELNYFVGYLHELGFLRPADSIPAGELARSGEENHFYDSWIVSVEGHERVSEIQRNVDVSQAFVAMWFDDSMDEAYEKAIAPAVCAAGYKPFIVNRNEGDLRILDDQIIGEIRRSRFVIADFTHGEGGVRGSVYYEAGFAQGLGLPVIFACRDGESELHFDTNHYPHIMWKGLEDLRQKLERRIRAAIGPAPGGDPIGG